MKKPSPKVALVYDRVNTYGGAERVLEALHTAFPDAPLYTSVYYPQTTPWTKGWDVRTSFLQKFPALRSRHESIAWLMPLAFESLNLEEFDVVISVTSEAAKGVITKPGTLHICYLLTPTRYLWSKSEEYYAQFRRGLLSFLLIPLYRLVMKYLRVWDRVAAHRPDLIVPISQVVMQRAHEYYGLLTEAPIYPPVEFDIFSKPTTLPRPLTEKYYLVVSRLVAYKRIDLAISACVQSKRHLVIVGVGSEEKALRKLANGSPYIHFVGHLTDEQLVAYYHHCVALLFPGEEDFGITAVEALAAGKPAVVYAQSGNAEVIEDGKSGIIMAKQTTDELLSALNRVDAVQWEGPALQSCAERFSVDQFIRHWRKHVQST